VQTSKTVRPPKFTTRPELRGSFGMVASTHWLASAAGMATLERGGNAFDAAVAAGLVLQVVEPHLNGPGGEVPIVLYSAGRDEVLVVDGQGPAPAAATIEHFRGLGLDLIPGTGLLPACVPGAFGAWMLLLAEFGSLPLRAVMEHAIGFAEHGLPVLPRISDAIRGVEHLFRSEWPSSAAVFLTDGGPPAPGTRWTNQVLASTYSRVLEEAEACGGDREAQIEGARRSFYEGFVADAIASFVEGAEVMDSTGSRHGGLLTGDDLAVWRARLEQPVGRDYHDYRVFKTGPWGQGPVFLQQLALLEGLDLPAMQHNSADYIHAVVECAKLAFADREAYYGDPSFVDVPMPELLDGAYAAQRRALVDQQASRELRPGEVGGRRPGLPVVPAAVASAGAGETTFASLREPSTDTCHVDVVDRHGNMVAATPSGGWLQSSPVVPGLGFPLGTRAQMFWLQEGLPNSLAPNKRPRTTLSPSIALKDGVPYLAFGTPGGDSQDQWTLNFFLAHVHFGMDLQEAIDQPTWHTTHFPSSFYPRTARPAELVIERRVGDEVLDELRARGHELVIEQDWSLGRVAAAGIDPASGWLRAAASPRGMQGYATGR
jgi:gamma-glutamyltranspeptidase/glutathione hydrolase